VSWHDLSGELLLAATVFAGGALAWHWLAQPAAPGWLVALVVAIAALVAARRLSGRDRHR